MSGGQNSRIAMMNFGEQLLGQDEKQLQMNNTWVPITPEKLILVRSNPISDWEVNQIGRPNFQIPVPGNDYMNETSLHYNGPDQNLHLIGQTSLTGEHINFDGNSPNRNRVLNHIASNYTPARHYQSDELTSNTLELLLEKNATSIASANRDLNLSINMAARNPLLPKSHPQASSAVWESNAGIQMSNTHSASASDIIYNNANIHLIPNKDSEFDGSNSNSMFNNDIHCSVSNQLQSIFSEIPHGDSYNLNYVPLTEADAAPSFTHFLQSIPGTMDQFKFLDSQFCPIPDNIIAENRSQEKGKQDDLASSTENGIQEYSNSCVNISDLAFDLNKTPEQKVPKRRKHRPKVILENKPKRNPKPASQKTQIKENRPRKRKNNPKSEATPQAEVIKETVNPTVPTRKSCRKALNFHLETTYETQNRIVCQQDIQHRNETDFNTALDYGATVMLSQADIKCGTSSVLSISQLDELTMENQQPGNTEDITLLLNQKPSTNLWSKSNATIALSDTAEGHQIAKFPVIEEGPAQGNSDQCQERKGCEQQNIHTEEIGNISPQSETCSEFFHNTGELICQNTLQLVPNSPSKFIKGKSTKRKRCKSTANQQNSSTTLGISLCQEISQEDENFKGATLAKGFSETKKRRKTQDRLHAKVSGRSSCQMMSKDDTQKVRIKNQKVSQSQSFEELSNCCTEGNAFVEQQNNGATAGDHFAISEEQHRIYSILLDEIVCQLNDLNLKEKISDLEGQKALVPYSGDGSIVPYQESDFEKKYKPRPKVDLDPETERTWKLLMGKEGSDDLEGTDKEREKWWEEQRSVFRGRADSFIARMHLVQGDRRFSKWKGSVVDSVIGVFLTQNVSDHLSSSAFMSLAARFPLKSDSSKKPHDVVATTKSVEEPELCTVNPDETIMSYGQGTSSTPTYHLGFETTHHTRELWRDSENSRIKGGLIEPNNPSSEEEFLASQDSLDSSITQGTRENRSCSGSISESEGLNSWYEPIKTQFFTSTNTLQIGKATMFQEFYSSVNGLPLIEERTEHGQMQKSEHVKQGSGESRNSSHNFQSTFGHPSNCGYPQKQVPVVPSTGHELYNSEMQGLQTFQMNDNVSSWAEAVEIHSKFNDANYRRLGINELGDSEDATEKQHRTQGSPELPTISYGPLNDLLALLQGTSQSRSHAIYNQHSPNYHPVGQETLQTEGSPHTKAFHASQLLSRGQDDVVNKCWNIPKHVEDYDNENRPVCSEPNNNSAELKTQKQVCSLSPTNKERKLKVPKARKAKSETEKNYSDNWDKLRKEVQTNGKTKERSKDTMDSLDYEALRCASVKEIADTIKERGMNNMLAERIKGFLNRVVDDHGSIDLEWLRDVPPDKAKDYLLSIRGLGLKSVECVRLLTLHHLAFPVDTNVGRIAVRLGWVPLQPLPESLQLHLLELYPVLESIQKYLWPRLCKLDQRTLYELHYQMITFGKVFCTKNKPNCNACPMRAECRHFASAFASARLALPGPEDNCIVSMPVPVGAQRNPPVHMNPMILPLFENNLIQVVSPGIGKCEPIIEEPATPEQVWTDVLESDIEDLLGEDPDEIPTIDLNIDELAMNVQNCIQEYKEHHEADMSKALVALTPQSASIPAPKLKNVSRLRTEHQVYELPDSHPLLEKMDKREPDDPSPYLLAIWTPGETANSTEPPGRRCGSQDSTNLCNDDTCFSCNSIREANSQTVRGTLLIPCRTATRGSFPLNGTYFQVNELFADHATSIKPIDIPRALLWNLPRRTVYFGTSVSSIFKGLSTQEIQLCFWRGFVCVRGFDQQRRAPRPLLARFHFPASKLAKTKK